MTDEISKYAMIEDLSGDTLFIAELCGIDVALIVWRKLRGVQLYVPRLALIKTIERYVLNNLEAKTVEILSVETGLTERAIFKIKQGGDEFEKQCFREAKNEFFEPSELVFKDVRLEDLTNDMRLIGERCGIDVAYKLWQGCKGITLNIASSDLKKAAKKYILSNHPKQSIKLIAVTAGLTSREVSKVVSSRIK